MALIPMAITFRLIYFLVSFLNERTVSQVTDPSQKFQIHQQIQECEEKLGKYK